MAEYGAFDLKVATLRQVFGSFMTGVTVVTTIDRQRRPRGLTANSFTSVSMEPPLVLVCIGQSAASHAEFCSTDYFAINILSVTQQSLSRLFASKAVDKFEQAMWRQERSGSPVLEGALAWIDCAVHEKITVGDHTILIGRVLDLGRNHGLPLGFFGGSYIDFDLDQDVESDDRFGIYVESDGGSQVGMLAGTPVAFNRYQRGESR